MRTALFLLAGFLLLAVALIPGRLFSANFPGPTMAATAAYMPAAAAVVLKWKVLTSDGDLPESFPGTRIATDTHG